MDLIIYPCRDSSKSMLVKGVPGCSLQQKISGMNLGGESPNNDIDYINIHVCVMMT